MKIVELSGGRGLLPAPAAASIARLDADLGHLVQITEAGRVRERQLFLWEMWNERVPGYNYALHPDDPMANHVLVDGRRGAVDSDEWNALWEDHGWFHTVFWPDGTLRESWHREYFPEKDKFFNVKAGMNMDELERLSIVLGGTVERAQNGESVSQRLDKLIKATEANTAAIDRLSRVIGGTVNRPDTISIRLDKVLEQTK